MPAWNDLTNEQRAKIIDSVMSDGDEHVREQIALEVYNGARKALGYA